MQQINPDFFIKENNPSKVLENITKYCSKCYKELTYKDTIYLNTNSYEYICNSCACCLSQEIDTNSECTITECQESSLF
jgi:hypothetical protein